MDLESFRIFKKARPDTIDSKTVGGFYEFDSVENAQKYIDGLLIPFAKQVNGNLSVKLFDSEVTREANIGMLSPFYPSEQLNCGTCNLR